ncbi:AI-2E family transporter [Opitutia bacterium ISCC 51]|nr:AI-2E family transporter [Opitutae bacterium ISCC 51]QXD28911.1 AI-2E family transporter [Opitutae bacterium ISCC 52]
MSDSSLPPPLLTPYQKKIVASAVTGVALALIIFLILGVFTAAGKFLSAFSSVIWPVAVATILTLLLKPLVQKFEKCLKIGRIFSIVILYSLILLILIGSTLVVVPTIALQAIDLFESIPVIYEKIITHMNTTAPGWLSFVEDKISTENLNEFSDQLVAVLKNVLTASGGALKVFGQGLAGMLGWLVAVAIIPVYLFYFLQFEEDAVPRLRDFLPFLKKDHQDDVLFLVREFVGMIVAFFRGQIIIALIMGILMGFGFQMAGLKSGFFIGLTIGLLNLIPYLGSILGVSIALPLAYFQPDGGWMVLLWVIAVMIAVQLIEGWILTPKIMGDQTGLHPVMIIFSVFFWGIALNGLLGMILAIPLSAFFVTFWRLARSKYVPLLLGQDKPPDEPEPVT